MTEENKDENKDVKFVDLFNPSKPRADEDIIQQRLEICNSCVFLNKRTVTCKKCGCFMKLKTTLLQAKCPVGKW